MKMIVITGTSGSGKSTLKDELEKSLNPEQYYCADNDEMGFNWWDYAGTDHEFQYKDDCLKEAASRAEGRHLVFATCMNPEQFIRENTVPQEIESTLFIVLIADVRQNAVLHRMR